MNEASTSAAEKPESSEAEYLRRQADEAKAALVRSLGEARSALTGALDPREVTRSHPFVAVGSAAVAGFVAALLAVPSKEQQELRRMEKLHRALHPEPAAAKDSNGSAKPLAPSMMATILKELIAVLKPILVTAVTAGLNAHTQEAPAEPPAGKPDISKERKKENR